MKKRKFTDEEAAKIIQIYCHDFKKSTSEICKEFKISKSSLLDLINGKTYSNLIRPEFIHRKDIKLNFPKFTKEQIEIINGSMLGDGNIKSNEVNACFRKCQASVNLEYLQWHFETMKPYSSSIRKGYSKSIIHDEYGKIIGYSSDKLHENYEFSTINHSSFNILDKKWYQIDCNGDFAKNEHGQKIKIVPKDLVLTPLTVAVWFCDDGTNNSKTRTAKFCTNGFSKFEVELLGKKIYDIFHIANRINFDVTGYVIIIKSQDYLDFINLISKYVAWECLIYKTDMKHFIPPKKYIWADYPGIRYNEKTKKWLVQVSINNKSKYLGTYENKNDAIKTKKDFEIERIKSGSCSRQFLQYIKEIL